MRAVPPSAASQRPPTPLNLHCTIPAPMLQRPFPDDPMLPTFNDQGATAPLQRGVAATPLSHGATLSPPDPRSSPIHSHAMQRAAAPFERCVSPSLLSRRLRHVEEALPVLDSCSVAHELQLLERQPRGRGALGDDHLPVAAPHVVGEGGVVERRAAELRAVRLSWRALVGWIEVPGRLALHVLRRLAVVAADDGPPAHEPRALAERPPRRLVPLGPLAHRHVVRVRLVAHGREQRDQLALHRRELGVAFESLSDRRDGQGEDLCR
mmetsp:Transcript_29428/g.78117  ORF Transcript_29428/g.78117 Transcript_29428/m.78117 type:complete len:266 (+) Transcript_29428:150-947(+)